MKAYIYVENGLFLEAKAFGVHGECSGELVFNTSMTGYQEILSDPSYAGQFIVFTAPEIGIVGANDDDMESLRIHTSGAIMRNYNEFSSNYRSQKTLSKFFEEQGKFGVYDVDTRFLTKMLRDEGALMAYISTSISDKDELKRRLESSGRIENINYVKTISAMDEYEHKKAAWSCEIKAYKSPKNIGKKVVVLDFGVKRNILNELCEVGLEVLVVPHDTKADVLIDKFKNGEINGVFLSNGPGEPKNLIAEIAEIKKLIDARLPIFGICLGHQLLSNAMGYPTYKLKFGQHGANHPVLNLQTKAIEITTQNHNYNVPEEIAEVAEITHRNLFDNTIEGVRYRDFPIFSVQHHPEASGGPNESKYIFKQFVEIL
ncbi:glutamine-hydrolyzing carbamoyl-phosphate synthase small subunit [Campylobacter sp. faydin G-140]|uniref:glutamine-hydrolyzing carbamoyl-phosphate synthase small subunit n=1 Tax=Campylobacter anatolicus TaxID=2829105 RepID=UPI001B9F7C12|nr:glutamine-hydrolyzing carbamoyl-phosphate synthase small subunit [Campylobacter anatolicus]MBR8465174.1 glutamine-hydrolyzing carbamoyl-phosphate synthase small subunit [Campylobacter anatolicus]